MVSERPLTPHRCPRHHRRITGGNVCLDGIFTLLAAAAAVSLGSPPLVLAESEVEPREIEIHDLEGHWYLLKLSIDEFDASSSVVPETDYDRRELYKTGLYLRGLCREQLGDTKLLLGKRSSLEDDLWFRSRLQVLHRSLSSTVPHIEDRLQQLEPGPILP